MRGLGLDGNSVVIVSAQGVLVFDTARRCTTS
jgi:hypothetical protein